MNDTFKDTLTGKIHTMRRIVFEHIGVVQHIESLAWCALNCSVDEEEAWLTRIEQFLGKMNAMHQHGKGFFEQRFKDAEAFRSAGVSMPSMQSLLSLGDQDVSNVKIYVEFPSGLWQNWHLRGGHPPALSELAQFRQLMVLTLSGLYNFIDVVNKGGADGTFNIQPIVDLATEMEFYFREVGEKQPYTDFDLTEMPENEIEESAGPVKHFMPNDELVAGSDDRIESQITMESTINTVKMFMVVEPADSTLRHSFLYRTY